MWSPHSNTRLVERRREAGERLLAGKDFAFYREVVKKVGGVSELRSL